MVLVVAMLAAGCGYRVAGRADLIPDHIGTIAVPAFENATTRYQLTQSLPQAIGREFLTRTRYRIIADPERSDAVLSGSVVNYISAPTVADPATGRAFGIQVTVILNVRLTERETGAVLFERAGMQAQGRYEISVDQAAYFDESDAALARVSNDVARTVVSAILENF
jgi:hypothetical protein